MKLLVWSLLTLILANNPVFSSSAEAYQQEDCDACHQEETSLSLWDSLEPGATLTPRQNIVLPRVWDNFSGINIKMGHLIPHQNNYDRSSYCTIGTGAEFVQLGRTALVKGQTYTVQKGRKIISSYPQAAYKYYTEFTLADSRGPAFKVGCYGSNGDDISIAQFLQHISSCFQYNPASPYVRSAFYADDSSLNNTTFNKLLVR